MNRFLLLTILVFHLVILSYFQYTAWPEMLSYPYLMSKGFELYKDFIIPYPPVLMLLTMPFLNLFGYTPEIVKFITYLIIIFVDLVMYLILSKIAKNERTAFLFLGLFVVLQSFFDGNMLWFDFATVPLLLLVFYLVLQWMESKNKGMLFLIGFLLSLTILIKQVALAYALLFFIFFVYHTGKKFIIDLPYLTFGGLIPASIFAFYLLLTDSYREFWLWTIYYPLIEWSNFPSYVALEISLKEAALFSILFLPLVGVLLSKKVFQDKTFLLGALLFFGAIIAIYPRFSLFHFQPALTFLIIILAITYKFLNQRLKKFYLMLIIIAEGLVILLIPKDIDGDFRFFGSDEKNISRQISLRVDKGETIFLLGLNSSQYVFTNTLPPKNWSDNFGWYLEIPGVQEWVLEGIKQNPPVYIFRKIPKPGRWYDLGTYQPQKIVSHIKEEYFLESIYKDVEIWKRKT